MGVRTSIKTGTTVKWTSTAGGIKKTKKGTVISVLKKGIDYTGGYDIPTTFYVNILRENGFTRDKAREYVNSATYYGLEEALRTKYKVRFRLMEGMQRDENHYLIEVADGERKPYLYHPRAGETFKIVK